MGVILSAMSEERPMSSIRETAQDIIDSGYVNVTLMPTEKEKH